MLNQLPNTKCNAAFRDKIILACYAKLAEAGFTRYRKEDVDWPLHDGFHAWLGLNTGLYHDYVEINPFIGVHVVPIMKLCEIKEGRKYSRSVATYAIHIGELPEAADLMAFHIKPSFSSETIESEINRLAELLRTIGLNYARSIASYETLLPLLKERIDMWGGYPERFASCLYLMGRKQEAKEFTMMFYEKEPKYFEGFAIPFLKKLSCEYV